MGKRKSEGGSSNKKNVATMCVYCGSSAGNGPAYKEAAIELASLLVKKNIDLVYGGGSIGLMGEVARAVHNGGCHVLGIVPKKILPHEIVGSAVGEVLYVDTMHQRKERMYSLSDAFIALPGGFGTMEELLEIITWSQIGIHNKPIGLLNVDGYYNFLLNMIDNAVEKGFISPSSRNILIDASNATDLMKKLEARSSSKTRPRHASPSSIEPNL